jgi:hypothetical protein
MENMEEIIGMNAGKVWTQLDIAGRQNVKDLKKATKLREKDLYAALGWLAREGKLCFEEEENGKELFVSLK